MINPCQWTLVGSGNRETPLATSSTDRFYTLLDYRVTKGPSGIAPLTNANLTPIGSTFDLSGTPAGCYLNMDMRGEKVVTSAVSTGGFTYFSTNRPTEPLANSCAANLGLAKTYRVPLFCGAPESIELAGGGLPPSPVAGLVEVVVPAAPGSDDTTTRQVPFIIGGFNPELSGLAVSRVPINVDPTRKRTYWFTNPSR